MSTRIYPFSYLIPNPFKGFPGIREREPGLPKENSMERTTTTTINKSHTPRRGRMKRTQNREEEKGGA